MDFLYSGDFFFHSSMISVIYSPTRTTGNRKIFKKLTQTSPKLILFKTTEE